MLGTIHRKMRLVSWAVCLSLTAPMGVATAKEDKPDKSQGPSNQNEGASLPQVPDAFPEPGPTGAIEIETDAGPRTTTLNPELQSHLRAYLKRKHSPIAAAVVADADTGQILAMAQGRPHEKWNGETHTALHAGFPAASLFKTVVATAAVDLAGIGTEESIGIYGGCPNVRATGVWQRENLSGRRHRMNLRKAFGRSCNGFFAKLAVNYLGLGPITEYARRYGWTDKGIPADFAVPASPLRPPAPHTTSAHVAGRYAAGFGYVGLSAAHATWMMLTVANDGKRLPLRLFRDTPDGSVLPPEPAEPVFRPEIAKTLRGIMDSSVRGGTASFAFRRGKHRSLRGLVGGKTGTLHGEHPDGITTWFAGLAPVDDPEVVVSAVVVLKDKWFIKGAQLAAEALWAYYDLELDEKTLTTARVTPAPAEEKPE